MWVRRMECSNANILVVTCALLLLQSTVAEGNHVKNTQNISV